MNQLIPNLIFYAGSTLLEGPNWDSRYNVIYFVSIDQHLIYRINPINGEIKTFKTDGPVGCAVLESKGTLLSAEKSGIYRVDPSDGKKSFLVQLETDPAMRYNDGTLDSQGRLLIGTKGDPSDIPGKGKIFLFDGVNSKTIVMNTTISNGIGFSKSGNILYFIDTPTKKVGRYYYDITSGDVVFDSYVVEIEGCGLPDGMCVDIDDNIWVAEWGGGQVCKWDPKNGKKICEIKLPCTRVTSCCLGGANNDFLYITTAKDPSLKEELAGGLFQVKIR
jgi:sugar lactone lactonase YvrE